MAGCSGRPEADRTKRKSECKFKDRGVSAGRSEVMQSMKFSSLVLSIMVGSGAWAGAQTPGPNVPPALPGLTNPTPALTNRPAPRRRANPPPYQGERGLPGNPAPTPEAPRGLPGNPAPIQEPPRGLPGTPMPTPQAPRGLPGTAPLTPVAPRGLPGNPVPTPVTPPGLPGTPPPTPAAPRL